MKFISRLSSLVFVVLLYRSAHCQNRTDFLEISKFVDGDAFWVKYFDGKGEKIRFIGMNTPESRNAGKTKIEFFGKEAADYVRQMLTRKKVRLGYDVQRYDRWQRTHAYIYWGKEHF